MPGAGRGRWRKTAARLLLVGGLLGLAFLAGAVFAGRRIYPYDRIVALGQHLVPDRQDRNTTITTAFHTLSSSTIDVADQVGAPSIEDGKLSWGGGITARANTIIGVTNHGQFFLYQNQNGSRKLSHLDIETEDNRAAFVAYATAHRVSTLDAERWFRHIDLLYTDQPTGAALLLSHIYWHDAQKCFTLRVSKLPLGDVDDVRQVAKTAGDWVTVYDTQPCLRLKTTGAAWAAHQAGGRIALDGDGRIILTVGDFQFDGYNSKEIHPQSPASDYGKILRIDPGTGTAEIISIGHRNPQGLALASGGMIWSTEHGPQGGDELNLIEKGANYGWPYVIYGTWYGKKVWPLSTTQGRHPGYRRPIFAWLPSIAVSNLIVIRGFAPEWDGDLLVASFKNYLYRMRYAEGRIIFAEPIFVGARVRDLVQLEDGTIVLWNDGGSLTELRLADSEGLDADAWMPADLEVGRRDAAVSTIEGCLGCHSVDRGGPGTRAPNLWEVYQRPIGEAPGYAGYSGALKSRTGVWTTDALDAFLKDPDAFAPGTVMEAQPVSDDGVRRAVVAYLRSLR